MAGTSERPARPRQRRRKGRDQSVYYVVTIEDWDWSFSYGVGDPRDGQAYADHRHLQLRGRLLAPSKVKADAAAVVLIPEPAVHADEQQTALPKGIGGAELRRRQFEALLSMPSDALAPVLQALVAGRLRFVVMYGEPLQRGRSRMHSYRLQADVGGDELREMDGSS